MSLAAVEAAPLRRLDDLPRAPGLPLVGNLHQLDTTRLHLVLEDWQRRLGAVYTLRLGGRPVLVVADSEVAQGLLRERPHRWRRARVIASVIEEMFDAPGVFAAEGDAWLPQRKLIMQSLAPTHFRSYFPALQAITARLHRRWTAAAAAGQVFDMREDLMRYTVDVTTSLAFGVDPNTLEDSGDVIQQHLAVVFPMLMSRMNSPLPYWRWFKLPRDRRLDRAVAAVQAHIAQLVATTRERMRQANGASPRNPAADGPQDGPPGASVPDRPGRITNLLEALIAERDQPGSTLTDADVAANVMTILLGGEDTTAISLAWSMPYLAADAALQERLHRDACAVLGAAAVCPDHDSVRRLDAFEAVVTESLRFRPTVPLIFIEPTEDVQVAGIAVSRGTPVWLLLRPDMLDERHFADALSFRPERWQHAAKPSPAAAGCPVAHDPRAHLQFGAGQRVCPGRHLATVEMRLVLSMLLKSFRVELACRSDELREVLAFTMMPARMPVRLHAR